MLYFCQFCRHASAAKFTHAYKRARAAGYTSPDDHKNSILTQRKKIQITSKITWFAKTSPGIQYICKRLSAQKAKRGINMRLIFLSFILFIYGLYTEAVFVCFNAAISARAAKNKPLTGRLLVLFSKKCARIRTNFKKLEKIFYSEIAKRRGI